ncbi:hypothetical protein EDC04DRAFT_2556457, partial [Pisolithus marmoratus]
FDVNISSLVNALKVALPDLQASKHGGRAIFIRFGGATGNTPAWITYNSGKAAMNSLVR